MYVGVELGVCKWKGHLLNARGTNGCASGKWYQGYWGRRIGVIWSVGRGKPFPRGTGQTGRQQLTGGHCHFFLSPLTCVVKSVYRFQSTKVSSRLSPPTSNLHGAVSSGRGAGKEVHEWLQHKFDSFDFSFLLKSSGHWKTSRFIEKKVRVLKL